MKKNYLTKKWIFVLIIAMVALNIFGAEAAESKIIITYGYHNAVNTVHHRAALRFKEIVEKESKGRVEVRLFPAGQLGNERDLIEGLKLGTVNMCYGDPPYLSNLIPKFGVMDLPYIFQDMRHVEGAVDGGIGKTLSDELLKKENLRILGWYHVGFRDMLTVDKPIKSLADFKGVKFRSPEVTVYVRMFKALGASPTPIPWGEVYTSLKTKVVDGMETSPEAMFNSKFYEVGKYVIKTNHINTVIAPIISNTFFLNLPKNIQQIIIRAVKQIVPWQRELTIAENDSCLDKMKEKGCVIIAINRSPLIEACKPVWKAFADEVPGAAELIEQITALRK